MCGVVVGGVVVKGRERETEIERRGRESEGVAGGRMREREMERTVERGKIEEWRKNVRTVLFIESDNCNGDLIAYLYSKLRSCDL